MAIQPVHLEFHCSFAPDLSLFEELAAGAVRFHSERKVIEVERDLAGDELACLRECHPELEAWQSLVDRIEERQQVTQVTATSAYPATSWSLLLSGLSSGEADPWQQFMNGYRKPIEKSLARLLANWNHQGHSAAQLADDFFGWFLEKGYHQKLKRTDDEGKVNRFRGYLKFVLMYYLKDTVLPRRSMSSLDGVGENLASDQPDPASEIDTTVDQEICRDLTHSTLEVMKRDEFSSWRAFLADFSGLTLSEVSERLKQDPDAKGTSVTKAFRERSKARDQFRNWLLRYRLEQCCLTREEAIEELEELLTPLAAAIAEYRDEHEGEIG